MNARYTQNRVRLFTRPQKRTKEYTVNTQLVHKENNLIDLLKYRLVSTSSTPPITTTICITSKGAST